MSNRTALAVPAVAAAMALAAGLAAGEAQAKDMEKCYGIAKAGHNDCQTNSSSCAGTSKTDNQGDAFILLPKGTCDKITGGATKPKG